MRRNKNHSLATREATEIMNERVKIKTRVIIISSFSVAIGATFMPLWQKKIKHTEKRNEITDEPLNDIQKQG